MQPGCQKRLESACFYKPFYSRLLQSQTSQRNSRTMGTPLKSSEWERRFALSCIMKTSVHTLQTNDIRAIGMVLRNCAGRVRAVTHPSRLRTLRAVICPVHIKLTKDCTQRNKFGVKSVFVVAGNTMQCISSSLFYYIVIKDCNTSHIFLSSVS